MPKSNYQIVKEFSVQDHRSTSVKPTGSWSSGCKGLLSPKLSGTTERRQALSQLSRTLAISDTQHSKSGTKDSESAGAAPHTLSWELIRLPVNEVCDSVPVVHPAVVVIGLQSLTGAVGLLRGHATVLAVQRGAGVAALFATPPAGQRAVSPVLHIHYCRPGRALMIAEKSGPSVGTGHVGT